MYFYFELYYCFCSCAAYRNIAYRLQTPDFGLTTQYSGLPSDLKAHHLLKLHRLSPAHFNFFTTL